MHVVHAMQPNDNANKWSTSFDNRPHHHRTWTVQWYSKDCASVHPT